MKLRMKRVGSIDVPLPMYQSDGAVGLDLHAAIPSLVTLHPGERAVIPTGLAFQIPMGYEGQVRARSGFARHWGVALTNGVGTIDPDFRGELEILLINFGRAAFDVRPLQRIAQFVIAPILRVDVELVDELPETPRGRKGFGSTEV